MGGEVTDEARDIREAPKDGVFDIMARELQKVFQMKDFGHRVNGLFSTSPEKIKLLEESCKAGAEACVSVLMRRLLADPVAVHINMLRGGIAKPSIRDIIHLYGRDALLEVISEQMLGDTEQAQGQGQGSPGGGEAPPAAQGSQAA